jgi:hypothetical protein
MYCISIPRTSRLKLLREAIALYCDKHRKHINTLCRENAKLLNFKEDGKESYHGAIKGNSELL